MSAGSDPITFAEANIAQRAVRRFASTAPGSWVFARIAQRLDQPVYEATRGRHTAASLIAGLPILMLTTTGAKSGKPRTVPVVGIPVDGGVAVIASNFGQKRHPAWFHNLAKTPEAEVEMDEHSWRVRAVEVEGERRQRIWEEATRVHPGYSSYEERAAHRDIHVFVLEPVA